MWLPSICCCSSTKSEERSLVKNEKKGKYLRGLESDDSNKIVLLKRWRANLLGLTKGST